MDTFFAPASLAVYGLSSKPGNAPKIIVENCLRWGFSGRLFGVNPATTEQNVGGLRVVRSAVELPLIPDLAVLLIPARYVPAAMEDCGRAGITRLAIQAGGFNESSEEGKALAQEILRIARQYNLRFVGPNALALADTTSGLCLPFVPSYPVRRGGFSLITQSGGLGIFLWNLLNNEQVGLAKFASIGNKLDIDECDLLDYLGGDPHTTVIGLYLESIGNGRRLVELAAQIDKPVIIYKANTTQAGSRAAMSHTAALSNDDTILDAAFARAGILRIDRLDDFVSTAKAFALPPMRGKRIMIMSPAGGLGVAMADLCERHGFAFADPGPCFYEALAGLANAGIIRLNNPLDMGDLYQVDTYPLIFNHILSNDQVDGAIFASQQPRMPPDGTDAFTAMFHTDLTLEMAGALRSSGKPLALSLYGDDALLAATKQRSALPVFNGPEEAIGALARQRQFYARKAQGVFVPDQAAGEVRVDLAKAWIEQHRGMVGEEGLELLQYYGLASPPSAVAQTVDEAVGIATRLGFPVVLKVVSPEVLHKTEVSGVLIDIVDSDGVIEGFAQIRDNLHQGRPDAQFDGVRVAAMAPPGHDLFIGGLQDPAFGPVVLFGYGGIFVEIFRDLERVLCPSSQAEIEAKIARLQAAKIFAGARGQVPVNPAPFVQAILSISHLMADHPDLLEVDVNPIRLLDQGGALALDARLRVAGNLDL